MPDIRAVPVLAPDHPPGVTIPEPAAALPVDHADHPDHPDHAARRPGRPPQTDEEAERARRNILDATERVFAEHGYHGINVAKIIDYAGIARPTFYRYFKNTDEAIGVVLRDSGRSLARVIVHTVRTGEDAIPKVVGAINGYLVWAEDHRHLLQSLYAGMHDPSSLIFQLRPLVLDRLIRVIGDQFELVDRARPERDTLEVLLNAVEFAVYQLYQQGADRDGARQRTRSTMMRVALAVVGTPEDWEQVLNDPEMRRSIL